MERRLLRGNHEPGDAATFALGGLLLATPGSVDWSAGWIHLKLVLVAGLTVAHH